MTADHAVPGLSAYTYQKPSSLVLAGSAKDEIERRKEERQRGGEDEARARMSVVQDLADELVDGHGLGIVLRRFEHETGEAVAAE